MTSDLILQNDDLEVLLGALCWFWTSRVVVCVLLLTEISVVVTWLAFEILAQRDCSLGLISFCTFCLTELLVSDLFQMKLLIRL